MRYRGHWVPSRFGTARIVGVTLIALAAAVALRPELAGTLRGGGMDAPAAGAPAMPGMRE